MYQEAYILLTMFVIVLIASLVHVNRLSLVRQQKRRILMQLPSEAKAWTDESKEWAFTVNIPCKYIHPKHLKNYLQSKLEEDQYDLSVSYLNLLNETEEELLTNWIAGKMQ
jgi:hypothetical protein